MTELKRHFSEEKIFDNLFYLFDALKFLHDRNIIHRDIKPR